MQPNPQESPNLLDLMALMRLEREEEKTRTARRLHDDVGQALSALRMKCYALDVRLRAVSPVVADELQNALVILDDAISTVREVSEELRPGSLRLGIDAAIELYAERFQSQSDIACVVDVENDRWSIDDDRTTELFRVFEEALASAKLRAGATTIEVKLRSDGSNVLLEIRDDGRAPDPAESSSHALRILTMKERAVRAGGTFTITDCGIEIRMPLKE